MRQNVIHLEKFYASRLGRAAKDMAGRRLSSVWPDLNNRDVLGYGFCGPYLDPYLESAKRVVLAMPGAQGALAQVSKRGIIACLTHDDELPFSDARFDYVLAAHGVEEAPDLAILLRELWRVTRPEGRIVVLASNRTGLWARSDKSPFGAGRPFSRTQLRSALKDAGFVPTVWSGALYVPPITRLANPWLYAKLREVRRDCLARIFGVSACRSHQASLCRTFRGKGPPCHAAQLRRGSHWQYGVFQKPIEAQ